MLLYETVEIVTLTYCPAVHNDNRVRLGDHQFRHSLGVVDLAPCQGFTIAFDHVVRESSEDVLGADTAGT